MKSLVIKTLTVTGIAVLLSLNAFAEDFSFTGREQQYRVSKSGRYFVEAYGGVGGSRSSWWIHVWMCEFTCWTSIIHQCWWIWLDVG